ncbi:50S ribosomal protein L14 [bacterium]|nr:MAG: 50S ribosomal protein L14 [bacterium]
MLQSKSHVTIADNSGAKEAMIIQVRGGLKGGKWHRYARIGDICSAAVTKVKPNGQFKDGDKCHIVIVRTKKEQRRKDGTYIRFDDNAAVIIDMKNRDPKGTRVFGPIARELKAKGFNKIISLAPEVL